MKEDYKETEKKIVKALEHAKTIAKPNYTEIAKEFEVPYRQLLERSKDVTSKCDRPAGNRVLGELQERLYITTANAINVNSKFVVSPEGEAQPAHPTKKLGKNWAGRFVKRSLDLDTVIQKPLEVKRQKAHNRNKVRDYFEKLHDAIKDVHPKDIWNMDEIGFQLGMGGRRKIITTDTSKVKEHYIASYSDRESLTIVKAVNAAGDVIPPFILFAGTIIHAQNARNGLPDSTLIVPSEKGFTTDLNGLRWLKHFDARSKGFMHVNEKADLGCDHYNIAEFLAGLPAVRKDTFKSSTIQHAFREAGIIPYNPDLVLRKMDVPALATVSVRPSTPPPVAGPSRLPAAVFVTPTKPSEFVKMRQDLVAMEKDSPEYAVVQDKFQRGSVTMALRAGRIEEE